VTPFLWVLSGVAGLLGFFIFAVIIGTLSNRTLPMARPQSVAPDAIAMIIPASGIEQFTPILIADRVYRATISGVYRVSWFGWFSDDPRQADGGYYQDDENNFTKPYSGILINGKKARDTWREDRHLHEYSCLVEATPDRLSIRLVPPKQGSSTGYLSVFIELQPKGTLTERQLEDTDVKAREYAAEQERQKEQKAAAAKAAANALAAQTLQSQAAAQRLAEEQCLAAEAKAKADAAMQQKVDDLRRYVRQNSNLLDDPYRKYLVENFRSEILQQWRQSWTNEYEAIFRQTDLVANLKQQAPEVLEWYERRT
jgi:hypothetical protein